MANPLNFPKPDNAATVDRTVTHAVVDALIAFAIGYGAAEAFGYVTGWKTPPWLAIATGAGVSASMQWHRDAN